MKYSALGWALAFSSVPMAGARTAPPTVTPTATTAAQLRSPLTVPVAWVSVTPATLHFSLVAGETDSGTMLIANDGAAGSTLSYTIAEAVASCSSLSDVAWLSTTPTSGRIADGARAMISVDIDSADLETGGYAAKLCVATSDPVNPLIEVPVTLGVNPPPVRTVGGTVSGLLGHGLELMLNDAAELAIDGNGPFAFTTSLERGAHYTVVVAVQPADPAQTCTVGNGSGTIGASSVTDVDVSCRGDAVYTDGFDGWES